MDEPPAAKPPKARDPLRAASAFVMALHRMTPRVIVTRLLVFTNAFLYLWIWLNGGGNVDAFTPSLLDWGASYGPLVLIGQWWRIPISLFVHANLIHLAFILWVLWDVGHLLERLIGSAGFFILYLGSGLIGVLTGLFFSFEVMDAGASGAVFGVLGGFAVFLLKTRRNLPDIVRRHFVRAAVLFVLLNAALGYLGHAFNTQLPGVDFTQNVGGLLGGMMLGALLLHPLSSVGVAGRAKRNVQAAGAVAVLLAVALASFWRLPHPLESVELLPLGGLADTMLEQVNRRIMLEPEREGWFWWRAQLYAQQGRWTDAAADGRRMIAAGMKTPAVFMLQATVLSNANQPEAALDTVKGGLAVIPAGSPESMELRNLRGFCLLKLKRYDEALENWQSLASDIKNTKLKAGYLENAGLVYAATGDWEKLKQHTAEVDKISDQVAWNKVLRLIAAEKSGNMALAEKTRARLRAQMRSVDAFMLQPEVLRESLPEALRGYVDEARQMAP